MIQRIQSFWLVLAACCMAVCFMAPVARYKLTMTSMGGQEVRAELNLVAKDSPQMLNQMLNGEPVEYGQRVSGFKMWPLMVLAVLVGAIALVALFLYTNRVRQMRVVAVAFLLNVVYVFLLFFWAVDAYGKVVMAAMKASDMQVTWMAGAYAPIVSVVLLILAHRGIKRDEDKVRAADRLR